MPYETKPMKKQWLEVDGRLTPIILPQIWNHELQDWVVTSEQNPLPTQVYGSIVDLYRISSTTSLTAGGTYYMFGGENEYLDVVDLGIKKIRVSIRGSFGTGNIKVVTWHKTWHGDTSYVYANTEDIDSSSYSYDIEVKGRYIELRIDNDGVTDRSLVRLSVLGVVS